MFHETEEWFKIWKKNWLVVWKMKLGISQIFSLENSNFILRSNLAELNQNKNLKQLDWPDAVRKLYFTSEISD